MSVFKTKAFIIRENLRCPGTIIFAGLLMMAACSTTTTQSFRVADTANIDAGFIATDADFSKYHQLVADEMGIYFPQNTPLTTDELQRLRQIFREAFLAELTNYEIVDQPGPGIMAVQASLIDLRKSASTSVPNLRAELRDVARPGELLFLMELRDSETQRVLGRAADSAATPDFASDDDHATDWDSVESAARHWATLFRDFLDNNLGR